VPRVAFGAAVAAAAAAFALPAAAAQIMLDPSMIIGVLSSPYSFPSALVDEQSGAVSPDHGWNAGASATVTLDLGAHRAFGAFDLFSTEAFGFRIRGANHVYYNGFGSFFVDGPTTLLASGNVASDLGGALAPQRFSSTDLSNTYRYLQVEILTEPGRYHYAFNEFRAFDPTSAAPEPATWALAICGFGLAGATLRRRRERAATA
jgi:hypothetical protein